MSWKRKAAQTRVRNSIKALKDFDVVDATPRTNLTGIPLEKAYRVKGVHLYADLGNIESLLGDGTESEQQHKRVLRFVHLYQRTAHLVLKETGNLAVDLQNHRLHAVILEPFDDGETSCEAERIYKAVLIAQLLVDVLAEANQLHADIDDAELTIGLESGLALAVYNGTRGDREALFLGEPANQAAKLLKAEPGVHLGQTARAVVGWSAQSTKVTADELKVAHDQTTLSTDSATLTKRWKADLRDTPQAKFDFNRATPPLSDLNLEALSPAQTKRMEMVSVFADVDGFSQFVKDQIETDPVAVARVLHVIRKELRDCWRDQGGRKIRYHGDCMQGVLAEGTRANTDMAKSARTAFLAAGALRSSFKVVCEELPETKSLGLAIGMELGPVSLTRLGVRGSMVRCAIGHAVLDSEAEQRGCDGTETAFGQNLQDAAEDATAEVINAKMIDLDFNSASAMLAVKDSVVKTEKSGTAPIAMPRAYS